jgi:hypothetical protein
VDHILQGVCVPSLFGLGIYKYEVY